jgi:hypothetical protein
MTIFKIELGAMIEVPIYETHHRGKNWMAIIEPDPRSPGGLHRTFVERGKGKFYYMVNELEIGQNIEFGADYYSSGGRKNKNRWYGRITNITDTEIEIEETR